MTATPSSLPATTSGEPVLMRALRVVALVEGLSFALLLICSLLKRTSGPDLVPVVGPVHGVLYVALVLLVLGQLRRLRWGALFTLVMLTVGSPGAHFAVRATGGAPDVGRSRRRRRTS